jgi:hypothetical protein
MYSGDWAYNHPEVKYHLNVSVLLFSIFSILSTILHKTDDNISWLKPFEMMSGLVTPVIIGLTDSQDVEKLLDRSKLYLGIVDTSYILCPTVVML